MPDTPLTEFVLGIRWTVGVREIYDASHILLRIEHPRLGPLDYLISSKDAMDFAAALARIAERRDETRMHGETPSSKPN
jgi:hypothetical protein